MSKKNNVVHIQSKSNFLNLEVLKRLKFTMYEHVLVTEHRVRRVKWFVVIKDKETDVIVEFSPYSKLLYVNSSGLDSRKEGTFKTYGDFLCMFLNYVLIDNYEVFGIDDIRNITIDHGNAFLLAYAKGKVGSDRKRLPTVESAVVKLNYLYSRIVNLYNKDAKEISHINWYYTTSEGKTRIAQHFKIQMDKDGKQTTENTRIFRDMPSIVFKVMLRLSKVYYPELTFAIALQAYAGLRPSEICNVRQQICPPLPYGINYRKHGGIFSSFEINLLDKYLLRNDRVDVGNIKKLRVQRVYTPFLAEIQELYGKHMQLLKAYSLETGHYPMFVSKEGKALTVKEYRRKMEQLVNVYLRSELLKSDDPRLNNYGRMLLSHKLSPHFLRHYFTVLLAIDGLPDYLISEWRGDSSLDAAKEYIGNKQELRDMLEFTNSKIIEKMLTRGPYSCIKKEYNR